MKTKILLIAFLSFATSVLHAQDVIHLMNGAQVKSKVIEVGLDDIVYKDQSNLSGPDLKLSKSEVQKIKYKNGSEEIFNAPPPSQREVVETPKTETNEGSSSGFPEPKAFIYMNLGTSNPMGDYGNITASEKLQNGYAKSGYFFSLDFGYHLHKNFALAAKWFSSSHELDADVFANQALITNRLRDRQNNTLFNYYEKNGSSMEESTLGGIMIGGNLVIPAKRFAFDVRLLFGYARATRGVWQAETWGFENSTSDYYYISNMKSSATKGGGMAYNFGLGARYNLSKKFFLGLNMDYISTSKLDFKNIRVVNNLSDSDGLVYDPTYWSFDVSQKISITNFSLSIGYTFRSKN